jgi:hypothetical protein
VVPEELAPLSLRLQNAVVSYPHYILKLVWPTNLTFYYPFPESSLPVWQVVGALTVLAAITLMAVRFALEAPYAIVGWLWYLGTLVPVLGIVQGALAPIAERFLYVLRRAHHLPCFGVHMLVSSSARAVPVRRPRRSNRGVLLHVVEAASNWKDNYTLNCVP